MPRPEPYADLRPSVLDRLIADKRAPGTAQQWFTARDVKNAIARDLEWLFATYRSIPEGMEALKEGQTSILAYGIPDLTIYSWTNEQDAKRFCDLLEEAIRRFEPRLLPHSVRVELMPSRGKGDFTFRFRIDAIIQVEPITEPVSYDTDIDPHTLSVEVKRAD